MKYEIRHFTPRRAMLQARNKHQKTPRGSDSRTPHNSEGLLLLRPAREPQSRISVPYVIGSEKAHAVTQARVVIHTNPSHTSTKEKQLESSVEKEQNGPRTSEHHACGRGRRRKTKGATSRPTSGTGVPVKVDGVGGSNDGSRLDTTTRETG